MRADIANCDFVGLSPRVRGNRSCDPKELWREGSIPACAGEPMRQDLKLPQHKVYPRVCGGTAEAQRRRDGYHGLSPRVRGNQRQSFQGGPPRRSIPACAGEPVRSPAAAASARVYPRVCGGTGDSGRRSGTAPGLSPRVRGNHTSLANGVIAVGSIPACAGEPPRSLNRPGRGRVYPRVCGGTRTDSSHRQRTAGLSPRVRGNPAADPQAYSASGSIPACAGEPAKIWARAPFLRVYPRVCGGTRQ